MIEIYVIVFIKVNTSKYSLYLFSLDLESDIYFISSQNYSFRELLLYSSFVWFFRLKIFFVEVNRVYWYQSSYRTFFFHRNGIYTLGIYIIKVLLLKNRGTPPTLIHPLTHPHTTTALYVCFLLVAIVV